MNAESRWQDVKDAIRSIAWCVGALGALIVAVGGYFMSDPAVIVGLLVLAAAPIFYLGSWAAFRPRHARAIESEARSERIAALERDLGL